MKPLFAALETTCRMLQARVDSHPQYADARNQLGLALAAAGDAGGARAQFEAALQLNPGYDVARFNLAWLHACCGDGAGFGLGDAMAQGLPEPWRAQLRLVRTARHQGAAAALELLDTLGVPEAWRAADRLWLSIEAGDPAAAERALVAIETRAADLRGLALAVRLRGEPGVDREMLALWAAAYRGNPHFGVLARQDAQVARAHGDSDAALRALAWEAWLSLDLAEYWVARGEHHETRGEESAATAAFTHAVELDPNRAATRVAFGFVLAARGDAPGAIEQLRTAARLAPDYVDVRYQLGLLYTGLERWAEAETELRATLAGSPDYAPAALALASVLETTGHDAEALGYLQQARQAGLRSTDVEARLAALHDRLGHKIQARRARARARAAQRVNRVR